MTNENPHKTTLIVLPFILWQKKSISHVEEMQLIVISNYGASETVVSDSASLEQVQSTMAALDWNNFHQVVLKQENGGWIEVSGNLRDDGFSCMYQEGGKQYVISQPSASVDQMTALLTSYLKRDNQFKENQKFQ